MSDQLFPDESPERTERRIEAAWASLKLSSAKDPERIRKAHDAYLLEPTDDEPS